MDTISLRPDWSELPLGRRIEVLRVLKGFSRQQMAEISDIAYSYYCQIEKGQKLPTLPVIQRIVWALGSSHAELLD